MFMLHYYCTCLHSRCDDKFTYLRFRNNHQVFLFVSIICYLLHIWIAKTLVSLHCIEEAVTFFLLFDRCLTLQDFISAHMKLQTESNSIIRKKNSWSYWKEMIMSWQKTIPRSWNSLHKKKCVLAFKLLFKDWFVGPCVFDSCVYLAYMEFPTFHIVLVMLISPWGN